jgi:hypothetical protein
MLRSVRIKIIDLSKAVLNSWPCKGIITTNMYRAPEVDLGGDNDFLISVII